MANQSLLGGLGVASGLNLGLCALGEGDAEHADNVAISGLSLGEGFDQSVPLLEESAALVSGNIHTVEVGVGFVSFHFFALNFDLSP